MVAAAMASTLRLDRGVCVCSIISVVMIVFVVHGEAATNNTFLETPVSLLLPAVNTTNAVFTCSVVADATIEWLFNIRGESLSLSSQVNAIKLNNYGISLLGKDTTSQSVTIRGLRENNNTQVQCYGIRGGILSQSQAELILYDPPDPPTNVTAVLVWSPLTISLSWTPPYTPFPDIQYSYSLTISISNIHYTTIDNIPSNTTHYLYNGSGQHDPGNCDNITFTLQSVNDAGRGDMPVPVTRELYIPQVPDPLVNVSTFVQYNQTEDMVQLFIRFKYPPPICHYQVNHYIVTISDITDTENTSVTFTTTVTDYTILPRMDIVELILDSNDNSNDDDGIVPDRIYTGTVVAVNDVGASDASEEVEFRTTDLHSVIVTFLSDSTMEVTCSFISGSIARGCYVVIKTTPTSDDDSVLFNDTITHRTSDNIAMETYPLNDISPDSTHQLVILGYDVESDGSTGLIPVMGGTTVRQVTRPPSSSSTPAISPATSGRTPVTMTNIVIVDRSSYSTTQHEPTPSVISSSNEGVAISSTAIIIIVSVIVGLLVLGLLTITIIIILQKYHKNGRLRSRGLESADNNDFVVVNKLQVSSAESLKADLTVTGDSGGGVGNYSMDCNGGPVINSSDQFSIVNSSALKSVETLNSMKNGDKSGIQRYSSIGSNGGPAVSSNDQFSLHRDRINSNPFQKSVESLKNDSLSGRGTPSVYNYTMGSHSGPVNADQFSLNRDRVNTSTPPFKSIESLKNDPSSSSSGNSSNRSGGGATSPMYNYSVGSNGSSSVKVPVDPVQPYGITTLRLSTAKPQENMYQTVSEVVRKTPVTQQNSATPLLTSSPSLSSSESVGDTPPPPPVPPVPTRRISQDHAHSTTPPLYHVLEQNPINRHGNHTPVPHTPSPIEAGALYDQVHPDRPPTATSHHSYRLARSNTSTPTPMKDRIYHVLEDPGLCRNSITPTDERDMFTCSHSTGVGQPPGILDSQSTVCTYCSDVFEDTDGDYPRYVPPRPPQRQYTVDQAKQKSRSLPMGARLGMRDRSCSVPDNHQIIGIEPYNTLERKIHGSTHTLKRTLV